MKGLRLNAELLWGMLSECEEIVLSPITDLRFLSYSPSLIAAATMVHMTTMVHMMKDQGHCGSLENKYTALIDKITCRITPWKARNYLHDFIGGFIIDRGSSASSWRILAFIRWLCPYLLITAGVRSRRIHH
ncbi:hypothetical protein Droror1_Dr00021020 [Drosera rotundifolia]